MFTGLVEAKGNLVRRTSQGAGARLLLRGALVGPGEPKREPIVLGESIAIDGVCLTVDAITSPGGPGETVFEVDASSETLARTTLGDLALGSTVNLERALALGGRLGGHLVSGHVDGVGRVVSVEPVSGASKVVFEAPAELARYIAAKGSISVSGVSLTINGVSAATVRPVTFDVMLIPHTLGKTSLDRLAVGTAVNLEVDLLARYVARLTEVGAAESAPEPDARLLERLRTSGYV